MATSATGVTPAARKPKPRLGRILVRRGAVAVLLVLMLLVPAFALLAATGQPAATYSGLGTVIGLVAVLSGGVRIGVITAIVAALLTPLVVVAGLTPITGAAAMALMCMTVGRLSTFGLQRAVMLVPIMLAWPMLAPVPWLPTGFIDRLNGALAAHGTSLAAALNTLDEKGGLPSDASSGGGALASHLMTELRMNQTYLTWLILFIFVGAIIPVIVAALMRHRLPKPALTEHARRETVPYTIVITVLTSVATYYFLSNPQEPGGPFFIAVILVLTQVGNDIAWRLTIHRVIGTTVGVLLVAGINALIGPTTFVEVFGLPFPLLIYGIGTLFAVGAIAAKFSPRYWIYYVLIVPTATYLNAFTVQGANSLGKARLIDNLVGATLVILAALITLVGSRLYARRYPAADNASTTASPA